jgi:hypothetical protein
MSSRIALTPFQLAVGFAVAASLVAVAAPALYRNAHASRLVEPVSGLGQIGTAALALAEVHHAFPGTAPLTPELPPRGNVREDPVGAWDHPTWLALKFTFNPLPTPVPHAFNFGFENRGKLFVATAHGDLDGDGNLSTFEIRGSLTPSGAALDPGMYVASEFE